jgi:hypothetical protein
MQALQGRSLTYCAQVRRSKGLLSIYSKSCRPRPWCEVNFLFRGLYTRDAKHGQQYSVSVMRLAAAVIEMAYQSIIPPPLYQDGEPEDLLLRLTRHIETDPLQPSVSPQGQRPIESTTTTPPIIRHRGIPNQSSGFASPSQSPQGPSPMGSSRQTPGRSGQRTPATPLTQAFSAANIEGPPVSNRRVLPPVPSSTAPMSPSSGGPRPLPIAAPARSGDESPTTSASENRRLGVKDIAHGLPHPGPCRYATAPIVVKHVNRCELCPTVTGKPGRPCVEEEVEVVVNTRLRQAPYPDRHPSVGSTLVYQLTLMVLIEILVKFVKENHLT